MLEIVVVNRIVQHDLLGLLLMAMYDSIHGVGVPKLTHHVNLVCAAAACLVHVHGVATGEGRNVGLVVGVAEDIKVVHFNNFKVVFHVSSIFQ